MVVDNNEVIQKRYNLVSILVPLVCVLLTYCGCLILGLGGVSEILPRLAYTACFGFILVFFLDIKRNSTLDTLYKTIIVICCPGLCFFVPSIMDKVGMTLIWILIISVFCVFTGIESSLIMTVGTSLYIWAFIPEMLDTETVIYITSVFMICVLTAFCDKVSKLIYASATFTVFYVILNCIFNRPGDESPFNMTVFSVWLFCIAMIVCMFFVRKMRDDRTDGKVTVQTEGGNVITENTGTGEGVTGKVTEQKADTENVENKDKKTLTSNDQDAPGSPELPAATGISSQPSRSDQRYDRKKGSGKKHGKQNYNKKYDNKNKDEKTVETRETETDDTAVAASGITTAGTKESETGEPETKDSEIRITENKEPDNGEIPNKEPETKETGHIEPETKESVNKEPETKETGHKEPETKETVHNEPETKETTNKEPENKNETEEVHHREGNNQALYDSIQELSSRLMKLESENSLLQLMLNASVYDLATISDPDYTYIEKLREESPKNYQHCQKVARISADAADLINCDSEEAYAIGMYIKAPKLLGDGSSSILANKYKIPKNIISSVNKINNKVSASVMSREAGIVMLTDDILNTIYYLKAKNNDDVSIERIVNNTIKVRKEQNFLRSAGFSNEEIQLLRLYYIDIGGAYDFTDPEGK